MKTRSKNCFRVRAFGKHELSSVAANDHAKRNAVAMGAASECLKRVAKPARRGVVTGANREVRYFRNTAARARAFRIGALARSKTAS